MRSYPSWNCGASVSGTRWHEPGELLRNPHDDRALKSEMDIEASYIETRLAMAGFDHDPALVDWLIGISQGLIVRKPSFVRAVNAVTAHEQHYLLVCDAAKELVAASGPNPFQSEALKRLYAARGEGAAKKKGPDGAAPR